MEKLLTIGQVAKRLRLSVDVVRSLTKGGKLKAVRTGGGHRRYRSEDVDRFKAKGRSAVRDRSSPPGQVPRRQRAPVARSPVSAPEPQYDPFKAEMEAEREAERERQAHAKAARSEAERQQLEDLKKYGLELLRWRLITGQCRAKVVQELEAFVTKEHLPSWIADAEAKRLVEAKVDGVIEHFREAWDERQQREREAEDHRRKGEEQRHQKEYEQSRIDNLIASGKSYAQSETWDWDDPEKDRARREVERALRDQIRADSTEADVKDLVDDVLAQWEDDEGDEEDEYEEDDEGEEDADDQSW